MDMRPETKEWMESILANDESSSDNDLVSHFTLNGVDKKEAKAMVSQRNDFLNWGTSKNLAKTTRTRTQKEWDETINRKGASY